MGRVATTPLSADDLGADLLSVVARLNRFATQQAGLGMPVAQGRLLAQVEDRGPTRISDLAAADHCTQPTMTAQVQRLEAGGLVDRVPDPADARAVLVSVTSAGRARLAEFRTARGAVVAPGIAQLSAAERTTLTESVQILRRLLES